MARQLKTVPTGSGGGGGARWDRGEGESSQRPADASYQVRGGRGEGKQPSNAFFPTAQYSTPVKLSFFYLRSAVEASLDTKKVQVEPNSVWMLFLPSLTL